MFCTRIWFLRELLSELPNENISRPNRALAEAIPIAKARGIAHVVMNGPERISDIAIVSKIPGAFVRAEDPGDNPADDR